MFIGKTKTNGMNPLIIPDSLALSVSGSVHTDLTTASVVQQTLIQVLADLPGPVQLEALQQEMDFRRDIIPISPDHTNSENCRGHWYTFPPDRDLPGTRSYPDTVPQ